MCNCTGENRLWFGQFQRREGVDSATESNYDVGYLKKRGKETIVYIWIEWENKLLEWDKVDVGIGETVRKFKLVIHEEQGDEVYIDV